MATKKNETLIEDPVAMMEGEAQQEPVKKATAKAATDEKDARIAELEAQLAEARAENTKIRRQSDREIVEAAAQKAVKDGVDPWSVTVSIRVPERRDCNEKWHWLCINGRSVQIPANNEYQEMKLPFAETLLNMLGAEKFVQDYADREIHNYDPVRNPKPGEG